MGFIGPRAEAEEIKDKVAAFLRETLGLELNAAKTLITHARSQRARFLGYDITVQHCDTKRTGGRRTANGKIALRVPPDVVKAQCARYRQHGKPWHRTRLQNLDDYDIVRIYGAEYRGVVNYYLLAQNVSAFGTLEWHAVTSMLKTMAAKHRSTVTTMAARHAARITTADGPRRCFEARRKREGKEDLVARFGGIPLRQDRRAVVRDPVPVPVPAPRKELLSRLRRDARELCETGTTVAVHQVTGLKALGKPGPGQPAWAALMARMRRKTLIVCAACHDWIHANPAESRGVNRWKAQCRRKGHAEFGGRLPGKGPGRTTWDLAGQPTLRSPRIARMIERTHVLIRLKSDIPLRRTSEILPDGSYRAELSGGGLEVRPRDLSFGRALRAVLSAIRLGHDRFQAVTREIAGSRNVVDRDRHRARKSKSPSAFPHATPKDTATRTAPAVITMANIPA